MTDFIDGANIFITSSEGYCECCGCYQTIDADIRWKYPNIGWTATEQLHYNGHMGGGDWSGENADLFRIVQKKAGINITVEWERPKNADYPFDPEEVFEKIDGEISKTYHLKFQSSIDGDDWATFTHVWVYDGEVLIAELMPNLIQQSEYGVTAEEIFEKIFRHHFGNNFVLEEEYIPGDTGSLDDEDEEDWEQ